MSTTHREAAFVALVLFAFGFFAMRFGLGEPTYKALVVGLAGGAVGATRYVTRALRARR